MEKLEEKNRFSRFSGSTKVATKEKNCQSNLKTFEGSNVLTIECLQNYSFLFTKQKK